MNSITKKKLIGIAASAFAAAFSLAIWTGVAPMFANAAEDEWDNYEIVTNNGQFVGVNIKDDTSGSLSAVIPTGSAKYPAAPADDPDYKGYFGAITFELGSVTVGEYEGILIQFDKLDAAANVNTRMFLEGDNGTMYRFSTGASLTETFVKADGSVVNWANASHAVTLQSGMVGTLYVPFSHIVVYNTMNHPEAGTTFVKLHYTLDTRGTGQYGDNKITGFGTIAALKSDGTVTKLLGVADLNYSNDAADTTADVNLADMSKGSKVYAKHVVTGSFDLDVGPADKIAGYIEKVEALWSFGRLAPRYTVNYVDNEGNTVLASQRYATVYDAETSAYSYEITPPAIKGYGYASCDKGLSGTITEKGAVITLTYEPVWTPTLTGKYVDESGNRIAADRELPSVYDFDTETATYSLTAPSLLGHEYVSADKPLEGTFTQDTTITLTFKEKANRFINYDVVYDEYDKFAGINIKNSISGGIVVNINNFNSSYGYALTTIELGELDPFESTGFLIKVKRLGLTGMSQVRMYLEDQYGNMYRLFTAVDDRAQAGDSVIITSDGKIGSVTNDPTNWRHAFQLSTDGTIYIPWFNVSSIEGSGIGGNLPIQEGTVFTKFHFGRETRYETTISRPVAIGTIGVVYVDDYNVIVDEVINLANLTYTNDANKTTADVNLADYTKGKVIYMDRWLKGTHEEGDPTLLSEVMELVDWTRMPPQIVLKFMDEAGNMIKSDNLADAEYAPSGSVYDITPPEIAGYEFVSADKELSGVADNDFEITLTYKKVVYTITLEFVDANGEAIKESRTVQAAFGEYIEIEADEIEGYTYAEASSGLNFTVMGAKTIRLTYEKSGSKGCGGNISWSGAILVLPVLAATVSVCLVGRKKSDD